jgi:DNA-directed RNA polymerase subunit RPC12/RpoP
MSLRRLYGSIPIDKRLCSYYLCQQRILRNIDRDKDGRIYHHGCLMSAQDERYRCLECFTIFDATEAAFAEHQIVQGDEVRQSLRVICPNCGCQNLKSLKPFGGS